MSKVVAVDIGGTKMILYTKVGGVVRRKREATGSEITPQQLVKLINDFINDLDFTPDVLGVCVPGLVENGVLIIASDRPNMEGLSEEMLSTPQYKAYLINDLRAAMFSQIPKYPKGSSICLIVIGTGIGMSVVLNGHFLSGAKGWVGEWGFCPIRLEDGTICSTERIITGKAIIERSGMEAVPSLLRKSIQSRVYRAHRINHALQKLSVDRLVYTREVRATIEPKRLPGG